MGTIKVAETIGLILILAPGILSHNKILIHIFGNRVFNVLANFVYGIYLVHVMLIYYIRDSTRNTVYVSYESMIFNGILIILISMIITFFLFIMIEKSCVNLESIYLSNKQKKI